MQDRRAWTLSLIAVVLVETGGCSAPVSSDGKPDATAAGAPEGSVFRCIKCLRKIPLAETELGGHAYAAGHAHRMPCRVRVHRGCGTVVFESRPWTARGRAKDDRPYPGPGAQCGSEIPWVRSLEEAKRLARDSNRPIAWWVTTIDRSPMDRKFVMEKYMLAGPFMMPGVVELLSTRFVPLRLAGDATAHKEFGVEPLEFIEPGFVFLTPDLKVIHKVDRILTFSEEWFVHLLRGVCRKAGREAEGKKGSADEARRSLAEGTPDPARFARLHGDEARYFHGVALHLAGRDEEGRAEWRKIREGRWAWKAQAELSGEGPFVRGFEVYASLPPDALGDLPGSTTRPRARAEVGRAVRFLLQTQRESGVWNDSNYNFGGDESLPNVYMAVTALAARALLEWGDPSAIRPAIARAERFMKDERNVCPEDADEIVWAHLYRLLYFARSGGREMTARLVRRLSDLQMESGIWHHEYPASFTTALVLHALREAKAAGADVPDAVLHRGMQALSACRNERQVYSYHFPSKSHAIEGAAGRSPLCEYALLGSGLATAESLAAVVEESFRHHERLEKVRKYDNHADPYGNAGFFFWYSQYGRALAARAAGSPSALARQKEIVLSTQEIDGCWVDSPELGRTYGTAQALLTLKVLER